MPKVGHFYGPDILKSYYIGKQVRMMEVGLLALRGCGSSVCRENIGLNALYIFKSLKIIEFKTLFSVFRCFF